MVAASLTFARLGDLHVLAEQIAGEEGVEGRAALVVAALPALPGRSAAAQLGHAPDGAGARGGGGHTPGVRAGGGGQEAAAGDDGRRGHGGVGRGRRRGGEAVARLLRVHSQLLQDHGHLVVGRRVGVDGRVAQEALVERLLGLQAKEVSERKANGRVRSETHLDGLLARLVLDEGDAVVEIEVEVLEGAVLDAERLQGAPVYLWREVPEEKPPLALEAVLPRGPPVRRVAAGAAARCGSRPAGAGGCVAREAGRRPARAGFAPQVLPDLGMIGTIED